jgi:phosphoglycerol transferase MdoB-like AlkP superfamily enzyme
MIADMSKGNITFRITLFFLLFVSSFVSYLGAVNPHALGLLSDLFIFLLGFTVSLLVIPLGKRIFSLYLIVFVIFFSILNISNWWHFQYFQSYYNFESLGLGADLLQASRAFDGFDYKKEGAVFFLLIVTSAFIVAKCYRKPLHSKKYYFVASAFSFSLAIVCWFIVKLSLVHYQNLNISILKPAYLHPAHAFFTSSNESRDIDAVEYTASKYFRDMNSLLGKHEVRYFKAKSYNVIYIVLESVRASLIGAYGNGDKLTPNIDALSKSLVVAKNFYANSNYTIKGEVASWCGVFDQNAKPPISKSASAIKNLQCLPKILAERGYETAYFHGNTSSFNSRKEFLPIAGFEKLYFPEDDENSEQLPKIGWGVSDEYMYQFMLDTLTANHEKPFFAHFMTVSSHYPYGWDWGITVPVEEHPNPKNASEVYDNYQNAVFYEDYALGKFWEAFKKSKLYQNTIVVITADHGVWVFDDEEKKSLLQKNEEFFRIPLLIYHPDIQGPIELTDTASQIDLPETVLNMLGIQDYDDIFVGKNLFEKVQNPWAIMMKQGDIVVRKNDTICYVEGAACSGIQQDCVAINYGELLPDINKLQRCQKIEGDLLRDNDAVITESPSDPELMDKAFSLIRYHNKKVFMD